MSAAAAFDRVAGQYDRLWSRSVVGRAQRQAVWAELRGLFAPGSRVLDLGCGTGEDAIRLARRGVRVHAIDASARMIEAARRKIAREELGARITVEARPIEQAAALRGPFDGALANFGALNCVADLSGAAAQVARLVRPGGPLAICVMGRFCLWETCWHLRRGQWSKAARRWRASAAGAVDGGLAFPVWYRSVREIEDAFRPHFRRIRLRGIGILVPPSYVPLGARAARVLAALDRVLAGVPVLRGFSDHRLLVFVRS